MGIVFGCLWYLFVASWVYMSVSCLILSEKHISSYLAGILWPVFVPVCTVMVLVLMAKENKDKEKK